MSNKKKLSNESEHEDVSSEGSKGSSEKGKKDAEKKDQHESVTGEGTEAVDDTETDVTIEMIEEDAPGLSDSGELEEVIGFDPMRASSEGFESSDFNSDDDELLPMSCNLEFTDIQESVCGSDDRTRITRTTRQPWRWICQLIITRADGTRSRCTGWFIGPGTVMTAGHCVYSHSAGGWARRIEVIPGMNGSSRPFGARIGTSFRSVRVWTRDRSPNYDYGAIILGDGTLGRRVGWFGFACLSDSSLRNLLVNNSGYPGDKPFGTQWYNAGRITRVTSRRIYYMLDTFGGQSGSPTWRYRNGQRHAVGIHAYGGCPNKSTRITRAVFDNMRRWKGLVS